MAHIDQIDWLLVPLRELSRSLKVSSSSDLSPAREGEVGDVVWLDPQTAEIVAGDCTKRLRCQFFSSRFGGFAAGTKHRRCDGASQPGRSCTAKSVVGRSDVREAGSVGRALAGPVAMDDGVQAPIQDVWILTRVVRQLEGCLRHS